MQPAAPPAAKLGQAQAQMTAGEDGRAGEHESDPDHKAGPGKGACQLAGAEVDCGSDRPEDEHEPGRRHPTHQQRPPDRVRSAAAAVLCAQPACEKGG